MRRTVSTFLFTLMLFALAGMGLAAAPPLPSGVNIDVPFPIDTICGFQIVVVGERPANMYTGARNPFPPPSIVETPVGSHIWTITWGTPSGPPCYQRTDSIFWSGDTFLGLHFGFETTDPIVHLITSGAVNATTWLFGPDGKVPGPPVTGHSNVGGGLNVLNTNVQALAVGHAQIVVSPTKIPINSLTRSDLGQLKWQDLRLGNTIVPGGSNDSPGTLTIGLPSLEGQKGWAVITYSTSDPVTGDPGSTVTLQYPIR